MTDGKEAGPTPPAPRDEGAVLTEAPGEVLREVRTGSPR